MIEDLLKKQDYLLKKQDYLPIPVKYLQAAENICGVFDAIEQGNLDAIIYFHLTGSTCVRAHVETAAKYGHLDIVKYFYEKMGFNGTEFEVKAFKLAVTNGHSEVVKYLYTAGGTGRTENAILLAARLGHLEIVKYLCEMQKKCIEDALQYAIDGEHQEVVEYLKSY